MRLNFYYVLLLAICTTAYPIESYSQKLDSVASCEETSAKLDSVRNAFKDMKQSNYVILLARLGQKEKNLIISERRIYAAKNYLTRQGVKPELIITAFAEKVNDLGSIEIFLAGASVGTIFAQYNKSIQIGFCDNDEADTKLYQLPQKLKQKLSLKYGVFN